MHIYIYAYIDPFEMTKCIFDIHLNQTFPRFDKSLRQNVRDYTN